MPTACGVLKISIVEKCGRYYCPDDDVAGRVMLCSDIKDISLFDTQLRGNRVAECRPFKIMFADTHRYGFEAYRLLARIVSRFLVFRFAVRLSLIIMLLLRHDKIDV